jgi:hypothetical protein
VKEFVASSFCRFELFTKAFWWLTTRTFIVQESTDIDERQAQVLVQAMDTVSQLIREVATWILATENDIYVRPFLIFVCVMSIFQLPILFYKFRMLVNSVLYFIFSWDKSWKPPQDPGSVFGPHLSKEMPVERRTIYFVRHGESFWNETFNKGSHRSWQQFAIGFIPGLIKALLYELYLLLTGKLDR